MKDSLPEMSRRNVTCQEAHTELSPGKRGARMWWLTRVGLSQDIITISQGALDDIWACGMYRGWHGSLIPCDIDPGVRAALQFIWEDIHGRGTNGPAKAARGCCIYPGLNMHAPGADIRDTVIDYCLGVYGPPSKEVVIDMDLTATARECWPLVEHALMTCKANGQRARLLLTFRNGRDEFPSIDARVAWMHKNLPAGAVYNGHHTYRSGRVLSNARRTQGSPMCVIEFVI